MKTVIIDIETDGLDPSVIWVIATKELPSGKTRAWTAPYDNFIEYAKTVDKWVAHNGISFDIPVLNKLLGLSIDNDQVWDTFVISRTVRYSRFNTHSLEELGESLGFKKGEFNDWSKLSAEMILYCMRDVDVTAKVWADLERFALDPKWERSLRCEHNIAALCLLLQRDGFHFNAVSAQKNLDKINKSMAELEEIFRDAWPPELRETKRIAYRRKANGELYANVKRDIDLYPKTERVGDELVCYDYVSFNPGSSKDRVDKLWEAKWKPVEKTDGHYKFTRAAREKAKELGPQAYKEKKEYFEHYGWSVNETNLETLPEDAPEGARALAKWLTLQGRRTALEERLRNLGLDNRIHTNFWHIGAWTHRMSHSNPNLANISSPFRGKPKTAVDEVKAEYDADMREMFDVEDGWLVGTDAESIQLRVLAHYLKNDAYVHAIVSGKKEDETDIHNLNKRSLELNHINRDHAKTFIYAWLLGAGNEKVGRILDVSVSVAKKSVDTFIEKTEGLSKLRSGLIRRDANRGYFEGLDGRKVICDSEYLMLAGYLQNGEAVIMKHANLLWQKQAREMKINFKQVNFVHDEWQTQVYDSRDAAEQIGLLQRNSLTIVGEQLGVYCPLAGETKIGKNWLDTH